MKTHGAGHRDGGLVRKGFLLAVLLTGLLAASPARGEGEWVEAWDQRIMAANAAYQQWFERLPDSGDAIDVVVVVRVKAFGRRSDLIQAWNRTWQKKYPEWDWWNKAGCYVHAAKPGDIPEVWMEMRQDGQGNLVLPLHVLGHEIAHAINHKNQRVVNPDFLLKTTFERQMENPSANVKTTAWPDP